MCTLAGEGGAPWVGGDRTVHSGQAGCFFVSRVLLSRQYYADCLCQAVYAAYCEVFPRSYALFDDRFKAHLLNTVSEWVTGERLAHRIYSERLQRQIPSCTYVPWPVEGRRTFPYAVLPLRSPNRLDATYNLFHGVWTTISEESIENWRHAQFQH